LRWRSAKRMTRRRKRTRNWGANTVTAFGSAAIGGIAAVALIEDLRYFAEGSPESFWSTWHIHPLSMFVGSLAYVAILYLLQLLNDRDHAVEYLYPYVLLVGFSGVNLALRLNAAWVALVAFACMGWSFIQLR
jgi:hypothetical protein